MIPDDVAKKVIYITADGNISCGGKDAVAGDGGGHGGAGNGGINPAESAVAGDGKTVIAGGNSGAAVGFVGKDKDTVEGVVAADGNFVGALNIDKALELLTVVSGDVQVGISGNIDVGIVCGTGAIWGCGILFQDGGVKGWDQYCPGSVVGFK